MVISVISEWIEFIIFTFSDIFEKIDLLSYIFILKLLAQSNYIFLSSFKGNTGAVVLKGLLQASLKFLQKPIQIMP